MYILKKFLQITLLLLASLTLHIIHWIPSWLVENIVNFTILGLFITSGYLVYLIIKRLHDTHKKRNVYKSTVYTLLLLTYLGIFSILQIGISLDKSKYLKTYAFGDKTFYTYQTIDNGIEVSKRDAFLPIRSLPIATFEYTTIVLKKEEQYLYAIGEELTVKVYDFKNNMVIDYSKNKK